MFTNQKEVQMLSTKALNTKLYYTINYRYVDERVGTISSQVYVQHHFGTVGISCVLLD